MYETALCRLALEPAQRQITQHQTLPEIHTSQTPLKVLDPKRYPDAQTLKVNSDL